MATTIDHVAETISIQCDGTVKELWEKCLILHLAHSRRIEIDPVCALVMLTGCTHEQADAAQDEMDRYLHRDTPKERLQ